LIPGLALTALALLPFYDLRVGNVGVYFRSWRGRYLTLLSMGMALLITPLWVLVDEFFIHWGGWLPTWPTWLSNGLIPLAVIALGLMILDEGIKRMVHASPEERVLVLFVFLFTALIVLTVVGVFFRGPGMGLFWPWDIPVH